MSDKGSSAITVYEGMKSPYGKRHNEYSNLASIDQSSTKRKRTGSRSSTRKKTTHSYSLSSKMYGQPKSRRVLLNLKSSNSNVAGSARHH